MAEKKPTFYMMVGVPGSGKSTYARQIPDATVLSSDDIRAEIGADGGDKKMHKQVFTILHERVKEALSAGNDVVYDATNLRQFPSPYGDELFLMFSRDSISPSSGGFRPLAGISCF